MLKVQNIRTFISKVPFMYGEETLTRVLVVDLLSTSNVVGLLLHHVSILLVKYTGIVVFSKG